MSADRVIASLLRVAKEDLDGAVTLSTSGNRNAIYLCAQAAEKLIRAVLTSESKHGGIKHQLQDMVDMVPDENPMKKTIAGDRTARSILDGVPLSYARRSSSEFAQQRRL